MQIKQLKNLSDKLLVFGGAYGNLEALTEIRNIAQTEAYRPEQVIFTGDAVAYCTQPEQCVQLLAEWGVHAIAGNVEIQLREGRDTCGCNFKEGTVCDRLSQQWYPFVKQNISNSSLDWMSDLPRVIKFTFQGRNFAVVHGSYKNVSSYIFKSTKWSRKQKELVSADCDIIIAGHCGIPFYNVKDGIAWINAGVIGMPANDGTPRGWYLTLEPVKNGSIRFELKSLKYDYEKTAQTMKENKLPDEYCQALRTGIWDNCEILPPAESGLQGKRLDFYSFIL